MTLLLGTGLGLTASCRASGGSPTPAFTPAQLFAGGAKGAWYDVSDRSTLFQDAGMTTPVTTNGDPVGAVLDKSGNGKHLFQTADINKPNYIDPGGGALRYLSFSAGSWLSGNGSNAIGYQPLTDPVYLGVFSTKTGGMGAHASMAFGVDVSNKAQLNINPSSFTSVYSAGGDGCVYTLSGATSGNHFLDCQVKALPAGQLRNTDMDFQVDGSVGSLQTNNNPDVSNQNAVVGVATANFANGTGSIAGRFHGGIVVLRTVTQTDRNNLRTHFSNPR